MAVMVLVVLTGLGLASILWLLKMLGMLGKKHAVDLLPGPPALPIFGNALMFAKPNHEAFAKINETCIKYWPLYRTWLMTSPVIHPMDPKSVEAVLTSSKHIKKSYEYSLIADWLGTGLLTSAGNKWHSRRKMLTPAFHFSILEQFISVFNDNVTIFLEHLDRHVDKKEGVNIVPLVTHCALDIICETAMGTTINAQKNEKSQYVTSMYEISDLIVYRLLRPWLYPGWIYRLSPWGRRQARCLEVLHGFTDKVIRERRVEYRSFKANQKKKSQSNDADILGGKKKTAFLDLLLQMSEEEGGLTDMDIREEVDTFMFEGHDTTAMAMSWALNFLGSNQDVQDKCVAELEEIFDGSDRQPTMADIGAMKYLERVIKETLRLRPSVFIISRELEQTLHLKDHDIPAGTKVDLHIYSIHRNPEFFPDPEKFDPDRFLPENTVGRPPYAYIPFSAGPRNCIGQKFAMLEQKTLLSSVLRKFKLESLNRDQYYAMVPDLILRPRMGLDIRITRRKLP